MKLKTLKELEKLCKCEAHCECYEPTPESLRQEAIKWIKEYRKYSDCGHTELFLNKCLFCSDGEGSCVGEEVIRWIKWFFNIKEDEVKK